MLRDSKRPSKESSKSVKLQNDRFSARILCKAEKTASQYKVILEKNDRLGFIGTSVEFPTVYADGKTADECYRATQEALMFGVALMIESGRLPPQPSSTEKRTAQVNIRFTPQEKRWLSKTSTNLGYRGISDYIRNIALTATLKCIP